ncbi:MAG: alanine racemase [Alphaproteobacteria bacterium]|nr:alanine racemase [Alphaproteobacteria bacterium]OJV15352.1 MAG: alanine racemase [Alphaproteobacteria bacterium 33-17]
MYHVCEVHVDLDAIASNYKYMSNISSKVCPVVKADSYGIGAYKIVERLVKEGSDTFFVATLEEALELRESFKNTVFYTLLGLHDDPEVFYRNNIYPVINSLNQLEKAAKFGKSDFKAAIQFDTGMSRNGMTPSEMHEMLDKNLHKQIDLKLVMSHLASSEEKDNLFNQMQLERFKHIASYFPHVPKSLANSGGILLGKDYHFDIVRPGIATYGYVPDKEFLPAVKMYAKILEIHTYKAGSTVGYNQTHLLVSDRILATIGVGYADGLSRAISNLGEVYYKNYRLPILGRVSMDTIIVDITDYVNEITGDFLTVFETKEQMFNIAVSSQTIPYEILTSIGKRFRFHYHG